MSDILERLNDEELWGSSSDRFHLRKDAIAEIERLRTDNERLWRVIEKAGLGGRFLPTELLEGEGGTGGVKP